MLNWLLWIFVIGFELLVISTAFEVTTHSSVEMYIIIIIIIISSVYLC